jgi:hypothetical protein
MSWPLPCEGDPPARLGIRGAAGPRGPDRCRRASRPARRCELLYPSLTSVRQLHDHGGSPPPAEERLRGRSPPSGSLSRQGKGRVNDEGVKSPVEPPGARPAAPPARHGIGWFGNGEAAIRLASSRAGRPKGRDNCRWPSRAARGGERLYSSLTFVCQLHDHGGSPPPAEEGLRGRPPPSGSLSREDKGRVNGEGVRSPVEPSGPRPAAPPASMSYLKTSRPGTCRCPPRS